MRVPHTGPCLRTRGFVNVPLNDDRASNIGPNGGEDDVGNLDNAHFPWLANLEHNPWIVLVREPGASASDHTPCLSNHASPRRYVYSIGDDVVTCVEEYDLAVRELGTLHQCGYPWRAEGTHLSENCLQGCRIIGDAISLRPMVLDTDKVTRAVILILRMHPSHDSARTIQQARCLVRSG